MANRESSQSTSFHRRTPGLMLKAAACPQPVMCANGIGSRQHGRRPRDGLPTKVQEGFRPCGTSFLALRQDLTTPKRGSVVPPRMTSFLLSRRGPVRYSHSCGNHLYKLGRYPWRTACCFSCWHFAHWLPALRLLRLSQLRKN